MLRHPRTPWILLATLTLAHFVFLASFVRPAYAAPDADGYYAQARMLVLEGRPDFEPASPAQYLGMHWLEKEDGRFVSRYPPGLSIIVGVAWKLFGRDASLYVNALLAALTLPLVFLLCRPYAGNWLALVGVILQAATPAANRHALNADSHTITTFCLVGGLFLLDRWGRRGGRWTAVAAGFTLAYIPLVRFAEAAAAIGVLAFLALIWREPERRREIGFVVAGAVGPVLALAAHNQFHFGAFWRTAYALTGESNLSLEYLARNWGIYSKSLLTSGVGYFLTPGVVGLLLMLRDREARPFAAAAGLIAGSITLLYCCYYFATFGSPVTVRFLLPTLPLYLPPALYLFRTLLPPKSLWPVAGVLLFFQVSMGQPGGVVQLKEQAAAAERSAAAIAGVDALIPHGAVILGERRLHDQLHFTGQWKLAEAALIPGLQPARGFGGRRGAFAGPRRGMFPGGPPPGPPVGDSDEPSPMQTDKGAALRARYAGLPPMRKAEAVLQDAEAWAGEQGVYWVTAEFRNSSLPNLPAGYSLEEVGRIELPATPGETGDGRPGRRGFPGPPGPPGALGGGNMFGLDADPLAVYRLVRSR